MGGTQAGPEESTQSQSTNSAALKLAKAMPVLYVSDVQAAADFYAKARIYNRLPPWPACFYASVSRDEACIHLRFVHQPMYVAGVREKEQVIGRQ